MIKIEPKNKLMDILKNIVLPQSLEYFLVWARKLHVAYQEHLFRISYSKEIKEVDCKTSKEKLDFKI